MTTVSNRPSQRAHPAPLRDAYQRMVRAAAAQSRFITLSSGKRVHVIEAGDGPPVVHLHGNNTSSLSHLMLIEHLSKVKSLLVDRPGSGLSEADDFSTGNFRRHAVQFVDDVPDGFGIDAAVLVGASGDGIWSMWYALDRPARLRGLVLLGSVPVLPGSRIPLVLRMMATPGLGDVMQRAVRPSRRMLLRLMTSVGEGDTIQRHPELLDSLVSAAGDPVAAAANLAELRAVLSPLGVAVPFRLRPDDLRRVSVPTLMIWGDHDPVVSVEAARATAALIADARLEVLPAGHVPQLGNPERVAALLEEFVASVQ